MSITDDYTKKKVLGLKMVDIKDDGHGGLVFIFEDGKKITVYPKLDYSHVNSGRIEWNLFLESQLIFPAGMCDICGQMDCGSDHK